MRVVTWNTLWRFGDWQARQPLLMAALVSLRADVVLLQETWPGQADALADSAGLQMLGFAGGYFDQGLSDVPNDEQFGNAILATQGDLVVDQRLASPTDPAPRRLLAADVNGLLVATTHLSHIWDRGDVRAEQLREVTSRLAGEHRPFVLAGDCNLVPSSDEYRVAVDIGLIDVWNEHHPGVHGPTMTPDNPEISHWAWMNDRNGTSAPPGTGVRLDYVWTSGSVSTTSIARFGNIDGPRWPSDHLGLVVEISER